MVSVSLVLHSHIKNLQIKFCFATKKVEVVGRARKEYGDGLLRITQWLQDAEELLAKEVPCTHPALRDYLNEVDVSRQKPRIYI